MRNLRILALEKNNLITLTLLSIALIAPLIPNQLITGSIVNMTIILAVLVLNLRSAILISLFPSLIAIISGNLNPILAPMIPFIVASNILLASIFHFLKDKNYWLTAGIASFAKFAFLYSLALFIFKLIDPLSTTMGLFQLITATCGSILAYFVYKIYKGL